MDDWLVGIVKDGKVVELYFSRELNDLQAIRTMHKGCGVETLRIADNKAPERAEYVGKEKKRKDRRSGKPWAYRLQCVETGETWSSVVECSKATGIPSWAVYKSIHYGYNAFGKHFITLHTEEQKETDVPTETDNNE